jgi:hypothetical protein
VFSVVVNGEPAAALAAQGAVDRFVTAVIATA